MERTLLETDFSKSADYSEYKEYIGLGYLETNANSKAEWY